MRISSAIKLIALEIRTFKAAKRALSTKMPGTRSGSSLTGCRFRLKYRRNMGFFFLPLEICYFKFGTIFRRLKRGFFDFLGSKIEIAL